ncbi:MAG: PAS domain S-box protein [Verrucomicrobia bacterium]|nr:PAS domain S-box protein [Verrucomicrobiota bacterium]
MKKSHKAVPENHLQQGLRSEVPQDHFHILSHAVDQSPSIVVITDTDGNIQYVNGSFSRVTGYSIDEVLGKNPRLLKSGRTSEEEYRNLWETITDGGDWRGQLVNKKKDGGFYWCSSVISGLRNSEGQVTHFISLSEDITKRKELEQTMVSLAEQERQSIGRELHDALGQQLTGISLLAKALQMKVAKCCGEEAEADAIEILSLVNEALSQTRQLSHGLFPVALERLGLSAALAELVETHRRRFKVECHFNEERLTRNLDHQTNLHLYRIAQEALTNAFKHGNPSEVVVSLAQHDGFLELAVSDNGIGLPDRADRLNGLGLVIMRYRAAMIGCDLTKEQRVGGGTTVHCKLLTDAV